MKRILFFLAVLCVARYHAQAAEQPDVQPYGTVDMADLTLKTCSFEKNANAMVLFSQGNLYYNSAYEVVLEVHKRVKIFNEAGKSEASFRLPFISGYNLEEISRIKAQTINVTEDGKVEITPVDSRQIFTEKTDKLLSTVVFAFPKVKAGSVIEVQYRCKFNSFNDLPRWDFQSNLPTCYCEFQSSITDRLHYRTQTHFFYPFFKETKEVKGSADLHFWSMKEVPSFQPEPFMSSRRDNIQSVTFVITGFSSYQPQYFFENWDGVGEYVIANRDFGFQMDEDLPGERDLLNKAKQIPGEEKRIAFLFNEVKKLMRWNNVNTWYTNDGTRTAWDTKTGNATEINLILFHLLNEAGLPAYPMLVSTREHGKANPAFPFLYQMNKAIVYVPLDSTQVYVLDASNKTNCYNEIPDDVLNTFGLTINKPYKKFHTLFIQQPKPSREVVFINAKILDDKREEGTVDISSYSYNKLQLAKRINADGAEKYKKGLNGGNADLNILEYKVDNLTVDSLPLKQSMKFKLNLTSSGDGYIYLTPAIVSSMKDNPFINERRTTDIDFGFLNDLSINGYYKLPSGYALAAVPQNVSLVMPDKSITFNRMVQSDNGVLAVRYLIRFNKSIFLKEDYKELHEFYKMMYQMLNEQIVLKKV